MQLQMQVSIAGSIDHTRRRPGQNPPLIVMGIGNNSAFNRFRTWVVQSKAREKVSHWSGGEFISSIDVIVAGMRCELTWKWYRIYFYMLSFQASYQQKKRIDACDGTFSELDGTQTQGTFARGQKRIRRGPVGLEWPRKKEEGPIKRIKCLSECYCLIR